MIIRLAGVVLMALFAAACDKSGADQAAQGAALLLPFKTELKAALQEGLRAGPAEAIEVCRTRAPQIAAGLSDDAVRVGRSSHRLRNPDNAPPDWVAPIIRQYQDSAAARKPVTVRLRDGRIGHAEPIMLQPLCLACHGSQLADDVAARIAELYPEDQATGFEEGDFRGVFWVEFSPESR